MALTLPQAGITPAVFFVPVKFAGTDKPIAMLADPIDPTTGELLSIERGFDPTDAAVINALRTVRESGSAVENVGHKIGPGSLVTPALENFLREEVRLALDGLVSSKQIVLQRVVVETLDTEAGVYAEYLNVARNVERRAYLPIGTLLGTAAT